LDTAPPADADNKSLVLFDRGHELEVRQASDYLLVSDKPLQEPVAWYCPITMNAEEELRQALEDLEEGLLSEKCN
jgi:redox-sensitive bicupin YhaK (pirin superfamily)